MAWGSKSGTHEPPVPFSQSEAAGVRYGGNAQSVFGDYDVLWEDTLNDYQGHATFLGRNSDGGYVFYEWTYGSCSGCDTWEAAYGWGYGNKFIEDEMRNTAMFFANDAELRNWLTMLEGRVPASNVGSGGLYGLVDVLDGGLIGRIKAVRHALGMEDQENG